MKFLLAALLLSAAYTAAAQKHTLTQLWQTDSIVAIPESVLPDAGSGLLYISLIDGGPWEKDGKGGIARMRSDGTGYDSAWVTGLSAPKGMGIYKGRLYVADVDEVAVIDIEKQQIVKRIAIDSAGGLNDVTISDKGIVYVSDSKTAKVWRIKNDQPALYLENLQGVNGLRAVKKDLIIASGKTFLKANKKKKTTTLTELPQGGDGIEPIGNGDYLVSSWPGYIFYVSKDGKIETLLETHAEKRNTADIGYDPVQRIVYVPTFFAKTVTAYKLD
jgi:hypothetical protein